MTLLQGDPLASFLSCKLSLLQCIIYYRNIQRKNGFSRAPMQSLRTLVSSYITSSTFPLRSITSLKYLTISLPCLQKVREFLAILISWLRFCALMVSAVCVSIHLLTKSLRRTRSNIYITLNLTILYRTTLLTLPNIGTSDHTYLQNRRHGKTPHSSHISKDLEKQAHNLCTAA